MAELAKCAQKKKNEYKYIHKNKTKIQQNIHIIFLFTLLIIN